MPVYLTPGVYRAPQPVAKGGLISVRTDVAGFVGYTERGPLPPPNPDMTFKSDSVALKITSWSEYQASFGSFHSYGYLPFAVRAFFENGGKECYVARVGAVKAATLSQRPVAAALALPSSAASIDTTLTAAAAPGQASITVADASAIQPADAIELSSPALTVFGVVDSVNGNIVTLTEPLPLNFDIAGTVVHKYPRAAFVQAKSPGRWGNTVWLMFSAIDAAPSSTRFSLRITRPGDEWSGPEEEFYQKLSIDPADALDDTLYALTVLSRSKLISFWAPASGVVPLQLRTGPLSNIQRLLGGRDGLAAVTKEDFVGGADDYRGLRLLEEIEDIAIVCIPDAVYSFPPPPPPDHPLPPDPCAPSPDQPVQAPPDPTLTPPSFNTEEAKDIQLSMLEHCMRLRYRVAVLDSPPDLLPPDAAAWAQVLRGATGKFGALYYPWLDVPDPRSFDAPAIAVPPSGHVAGIYARNDFRNGVRKPPANEPLDFATDVAFLIDDESSGDLNLARVNCIRPLPGRGIRVWGARALSSASDTNWMFIHTRRLMSFIEASVERSTRWTVFEPNDDRLRRALVHSLNVFLERIWESGGLKGATTDQSFFVKCDATNNPQSVIDNGQLICQVGIAIAAPMEFIIFEIRRNVESAQVVEEEQSS